MSNASIAIVLAACISTHAVALELEKDIPACIDADAFYLLGKYIESGDTESYKKLFDGELCKTTGAGAAPVCVDEEVLFLLTKAIEEENRAYHYKLFYGGLCKVLPAGTSYEIIEKGMFVTAIKVTGTNSILHTNLF